MANTLVCVATEVLRTLVSAVLAAVEQMLPRAWAWHMALPGCDPLADVSVMVPHGQHIVACCSVGLTLGLLYPPHTV